MGTGKRYPNEMKERAVRFVLEQQNDYESQWSAIERVEPGTMNRLRMRWSATPPRPCWRRFRLDAGDSTLRVTYALRPPADKKVIWGLLQSGAAAVLLVAGGLAALQRMVIIDHNVPVAWASTDAKAPE